MPFNLIMANGLTINQISIIDSFSSPLLPILHKTDDLVGSAVQKHIQNSEVRFKEKTSTIN